jgi:hypothetical protein
VFVVIVPVAYVFLFACLAAFEAHVIRIMCEWWSVIIMHFTWFFCHFGSVVVDSALCSLVLSSSWQIKSVVQLVVHTDLTVKCHDLFHMADGCHDIGLLIEENVCKYKEMERSDCNFLLR